VGGWLAHRFQILQPISDFSGQASFARNVNCIWACRYVLLKVFPADALFPAAPQHSDLGYQSRASGGRHWF